ADTPEVPGVPPPTTPDAADLAVTGDPNQGGSRLGTYLERPDPEAERRMGFAFDRALPEQAPESPKPSFAFAGDVSVNIIKKENTYAFINDRGTITTSDAPVLVSAEAQTAIWSLAGSVAIAKSETTSFGIAGSISVNVMNGDTRAFVSSATVDARAIDVEAGRGDGMRALTAGGAGAFSQEGIGIAGSFSINAGLFSAVSYVSGATLHLQDESSVTAKDESNIWSVGGALAYGGAVGIGAGIAVNFLGTSDNPNTTRAYAENSTTTRASGNPLAQAENQNRTVPPRIVAVTAAIAISTGSQAALAGAGMVSVNLINSRTSAEIIGSTVSEPSTGEGSVEVHAADTSGIISIGGAVGVTTRGFAIGAAIGFNHIQTTTVAAIEDSQITTPGSLEVTAESNATNVGVSLGVAVVAGQTGLAGAGAVSVNLIQDTTDAHVSNHSHVTAGGPVVVSASDHSLLVSIAGGVAGAGTAAAGGAISYNLVENAIEAYVDSSTVHADDGALTISVTSSPLLIPVAGGGAGAAQFAFRGGDPRRTLSTT